MRSTRECLEYSAIGRETGSAPCESLVESRAVSFYVDLQHTGYLESSAIEISART